MRFYQPENGATRINGGWCIFPKTIGGETRWMEWATWDEEYKSCKGGRHWVAVRWAA